MKKFVFVEKRIYVAEVTFKHAETNAYKVYKAFTERFPEAKARGHEYIYINKEEGLCRIYSESVWDFVEQ